MNVKDQLQDQYEVDRTPICVDLDGTLIVGDLLHEAAIAAVKKSPLDMLIMLRMAIQGPMALKAFLVENTVLDPTTLPYRDDLIAQLAEERAHGRPIFLVTASPQAWAEQIAAHLGIFDGVYGTSDVNMKGATKSSFLEKRFPDGFDYVGDAKADLLVWCKARRIMRAGRGVHIKLGKSMTSFRDFPAIATGRLPILRGMRPHQWLKNILIFLPILASHRLNEPWLIFLASLAFIAFSLAASATYILNDILDIPADRKHPRKRTRPFASGAISIPEGFFIASGLGVVAIIIATLVGVTFLLSLLIYVVITLAYSMRLKRAMLIDVFTLAVLYAFRIVAGAVSVNVPLSIWLIDFSLFLFLALAIIKRCAELVDYEGVRTDLIAGRGYFNTDLIVLQVIGGASSFAAALVLSLYAGQPEVARLYGTPEFLWLLSPLILYWLSRMMLLAQRNNMHDDPIVFAVTEPKSMMLVLIGCVIVMAATMLKIPMGLFVLGR